MKIDLYNGFPKKLILNFRYNSGDIAAIIMKASPNLKSGAIKNQNMTPKSEVQITEIVLISTFIIFRLATNNEIIGKETDVNSISL